MAGQNERGLRLLSIDGGGIRGLSPLLMLKEIMYRIQKDDHLQELPRPCDVFDLAGGTSTGGLIVIMLFRLRMPIDKAIEAYASLARTVFSEKKWFFQEGTFKASRLENAIISIIRSTSLPGQDGDPQEVKMLNEDGPKCFVCATVAGNLRFPTFFRSWTPPSNQTFDCTIIQAVRATTAAPTFFKAIEFGHPLTQRYLDGGLRCNNPVKYVVDEAMSLYPHRPISCLLSLGTGTTQVIGLERPDAFQNMLPMRLIGVLRDIATDCDEQSEAMAKQLHAHSYFRLNVNEGLQNVSLAEWSRLNEVEIHTVQYLKTNDVGKQVDQLVKLLTAKADPLVRCSAPPPTTLSTDEQQAFKELQKSIPIGAYYDSEELSASAECMAGTREIQTRTLMQWVNANDKAKPLFIVLGPAGSGKSSFLRTIARMCKEQKFLAASFFFSGTDSARNVAKNLMSTIAYQISEAIPEFRPYVARSIDAEPTLFSRSLESQTQQLLLDPLSRLRSEYPTFSLNSHPRLIVIDALDECLEFNDQIRVISALGKVLTHESFPFLCLLSSRYNPHIEKNLTNVLAPRVYGSVKFGSDIDGEMGDIRAYLQANVDRIRDEHAFGSRIPQEWPLASDLETIVSKSGGQFIYVSTVIKYVESPEHNPHERLRYILGISSAKSGEDPFAELDALYLALMSSVKNLAAVVEVLGIELVRLNTQSWVPDAMKGSPYYFALHYQSMDADIPLAPLASVLQYERGFIRFYHLSFAEFLLDSTRSREYFIHPTKWQKWIVSRFVTRFLNLESCYISDVKYLTKEARPGTDLHQWIDDAPASYPEFLFSGDNLDSRKFNIWPFVTSAFFAHLQLTIPDSMVPVIFNSCPGNNFLPLSILMKLMLTTNLSNSFLLFEFCRTLAEWQKLGSLDSDSYQWTYFSTETFLLFTTYLADYLENRRVLSPDDYCAASLRCLWYLQSFRGVIHISLLRQIIPLKYLPSTFGIYSYLNDTSTNITCGAIDTLPLLLPHASPSINLLTALKQPFDSGVLTRTPSSSRKALHNIHDYLMEHDPEYRQGEHPVFAGQDEAGDDEPLVDFEIFLHQKGSEIPPWIHHSISKGE